MSEELNPVDLEAAADAAGKAELRDRQERERVRNNFLWIMSEPKGRWFVWRLMRESGAFQDCSSSDPHEMARFLGERRQGLRLLNQVLEYCPEHWLNMVKEQRRGP